MFDELNLFFPQIDFNIKYKLSVSIKQMYSTNKIFSSPFDSSSKKKRIQGDRFIPNCVAKNLYSLFEEASHQKHEKTGYTNLLSQQLFPPATSKKILNFNENYQEKENINENVNINYQHDKKQSKNKKTHISKKPYKILDAPMLKDDFYLNLVDWSDSNNIGVGLQSSIYIWSGCSSKVQRLYQSIDPSDYVCSLGFLRHSPRMAVGFLDGRINVFDILKHKQCQSFEGLHSGRIGSLGCTNNLICTGGRDGLVSIQDYRMNTEIMRYRAHNQQICGLKISPDGTMIASGGNDNKMVLFSLKTMNKMAVWNDHNAAVKAIGFNPNDPSIASGGGTADRKIRIFSLQTLEMINSIDTGSQICNLMYSSISNELVTTHGYSLNQINLWKWQKDGSLKKTDSLMGHKKRVLYLAGQNQGCRVVTGAGDQQLRLWRIFDEQSTYVPYDLR